MACPYEAGDKPPAVPCPVPEAQASGNVVRGQAPALHAHGWRVSLKSDDFVTSVRVFPALFGNMRNYCCSARVTHYLVRAVGRGRPPYNIYGDIPQAIIRKLA